MRVVSSNIEYADYNRVTRVLTLRFISRPLWEYSYYKVSSRIWTEFVRSQSKGRYFADFIKDKYKFTKKVTNGKNHKNL